MPSASLLLTLASAISSASAVYQGFNYGATFTDNRPKTQSDFEAEFKTAAGLIDTKGAFRSARLFTMVQAGSTDEPISAIPAAINTKTSLLLGLWASAGEASFKNEISALKKTAQQYCSQLDGLVAGISVGSEDLYRNSPTGMQAGENPGANPDVLVNYIRQTREAIKGTCLKDAPIGHVDTWTAYVNDTNKAVAQALDWVGMDAYPYFESTKQNDIGQGKMLFEAALRNTRDAVGGKEVWITETGWPVSGKKSGEAEATVENAEAYWKEVACSILGKMNVWWYTLQDSAPGTPNPSFGVVGSQLSTTPLYDLSCNLDGVLSSSAPANISRPVKTKTRKTSWATGTGYPQSSHYGNTTAVYRNSTSVGGSVATGSRTVPVTSLTEGPKPTGGDKDKEGGKSSNGGGIVQPTGPATGSQTSNGGSNTQPPPTRVVTGSASKLNSMGAISVALLLAAVAL